MPIASFRRKALSTDQILQKVRHFCAYQERCHQEVREKFFLLGMKKQDADAALATLIEEDYLNEERFAIQYAGGKFRMKQWGREKIQYSLREKRVSDYAIQRALQEIPEEDYRKTLLELARKKWEVLEETEANARRSKLIQFLKQRGFEYADAKEAIQELNY